MNPLREVITWIFNGRITLDDAGNILDTTTATRLGWQTDYMPGKKPLRTSLVSLEFDSDLGAYVGEQL